MKMYAQFATAPLFLRQSRTTWGASARLDQSLRCNHELLISIRLRNQSYTSERMAKAKRSRDRVQFGYQPCNRRCPHGTIVSLSLNIDKAGQMSI